MITNMLCSKHGSVSARFDERCREWVCSQCHPLSREEMSRRVAEALASHPDPAPPKHNISTQDVTDELAALRAVEEAARDAIAQIHDQRTLWPAEVDTLDDALAALDKIRGKP